MMDPILVRLGEEIFHVIWACCVFVIAWRMAVYGLNKGMQRMDQAEEILRVAAEHRKAISEAIMLYNYGAREEAKQLLEDTPYSFGESDERKTEHSR